MTTSLAIQECDAAQRYPQQHQHHLHTRQRLVTHFCDLLDEVSASMLILY